MKTVERKMKTGLYSKDAFDLLFWIANNDVDEMHNELFGIGLSPEFFEVEREPDGEINFAIYEFRNPGDSVEFDNKTILKAMAIAIEKMSEIEDKRLDGLRKPVARLLKGYKLANKMMKKLKGEPWDQFKTCRYEALKRMQEELKDRRSAAFEELEKRHNLEKEELANRFKLENEKLEKEIGALG